ncbi:MAG: hypothetical protein QM747_03265 [Nocardioides sp.]
MSDSVGSVSVDVVPDARGWSEKLRAQIRDQTVTINANADTSEAEAQLDEAAHTRTATIRADTSQLSKSNGVLGSFVDRLGLLPALAIAAGAALVPLAATLGGITAALAAPLIIGGGAATLFAFLGGFAVKETTTQLKNIDSLQKKLAGLTKGTKEYAQTQKQLRDAQAGLTPAQKEFASSLAGLKGSFSTLLTGQAGQQLLGTISQGLDLLSKSLPLVAPLIGPVASAFDQLLGDASKAAGSKGFADFVSQVGRLAKPDILAAGHIAGNLAVGIGGLLVALDKGLSGGVLGGLERLTGDFADFGKHADKSSALQGFLDYFHQVGPQVGRTIESVATAIAHIVRALAPLGPPVLRVVQGIADALSSIPPGALTAILAGTAGLSVAAYGGRKIGQIGGFLSNIPGVGGTGIGGVQKVYVVNLPPGGIGGVGGVAAAGRTATVAEEAGLAATVGARAGLFSRLIKGIGLDLPLPAIGSETGTTGGIPNYGTKFDTNHVLSMSEYLKQVGGTSGTSLKSTGTALNALQAGLAATSRGYDLMGHSAATNSASAIRALRGVQTELGRFHPVSIPVLVQASNAIHSLEALQAYRVHDKSFNIYARYQGYERAVGPGGGRGMTPPGSGSGGGAGEIHTHVHLNGKEIAHAINPYMEQSADRVYQANRQWERDVSGQ